MMAHKKHLKTILCGTALCLFFLVNLSGCTSTSNQNANQTTTQLTGTWVGNAETPMGIGGENVTVSQITFTNNIAQLTLTSTRGAFTMNYTYTMNGNTLSLTPEFSNRGGFPRQPSQNGTRSWNDTARPFMNETWPTNETRPDNWTRPSNWTRPENGIWSPDGGQRSLSVSFTYSLNVDRTILTLNGAEFRKVQ
jgi:hypothetical protein